MIFDNAHAVGVLSPCALVWTNCQSKNAFPRIRNSAQRPTLSECFEATLTLAADYRSVVTSAIYKDSLTLNSCCLSAIHRPPARLRGHGGLLSAMTGLHIDYREKCSNIFALSAGKVTSGRQ